MKRKLKSADMLNINLTYGCLLSLSKTIEQLKQDELVSDEARMAMQEGFQDRLRMLKSRPQMSYPIEEIKEEPEGEENCLH
jgi:hypothetical protein